MKLPRHPKFQNIDDEVVKIKEVDGGHVIAFIPNPNRDNLDEISKKIALIKLRDYLNSKRKGFV